VESRQIASDMLSERPLMLSKQMKCACRAATIKSRSSLGSERSCGERGSMSEPRVLIPEVDEDCLALFADAGVHRKLGTLDHRKHSDGGERLVHRVRVHGFSVFLEIALPQPQ